MHLSKIDVRGTEQEFSSACGGDLRRGGGGGMECPTTWQTYYSRVFCTLPLTRRFGPISKDSVFSPFLSLFRA